MERADQETRQAIIADIELAFGDVRRGDGVTLHQARVKDDYGSAQEEAEARKKDTDTRWQEIPESWIERLGDALTFVDDPEGFRYYLPAFMIWILNNYEESDAVAADQVASLLGDYVLPRQMLNRCRLFTHAQMRAVARFLQCFAGFADDTWAQYARKALDQHWHKFL